jgi:hypothetical protein
MPVIPVNKVLDTKRIIGKNWWPLRRRGKRGLCPTPHPRQKYIYTYVRTYVGQRCPSLLYSLLLPLCIPVPFTSPQPQQLPVKVLLAFCDTDKGHFRGPNHRVLLITRTDNYIEQMFTKLLTSVSELDLLELTKTFIIILTFMHMTRIPSTHVHVMQFKLWHW